MNKHEAMKTIAMRYEGMLFNPESRHTTIMDLEVVEKEFPECDFVVFAGERDSDFSHDIFGIKRHINRKTMTIEGCFVPRFVHAS